MLDDELMGGSLDVVEPPPEPQKAIVAFGEAMCDVAVVWATKGIHDDMKEAGYGAEEMFEHGFEDTPDHGIWVWEGYIVGIVHPSTPNGPEEYDVEYRGEWRKPSKKEWASISENRNPFIEEAMA